MLGLSQGFSHPHHTGTAALSGSRPPLVSCYKWPRKKEILGQETDPNSAGTEKQAHGTWRPCGTCPDAPTPSEDPQRVVQGDYCHKCRKQGVQGINMVSDQRTEPGLLLLH